MKFILVVDQWDIDIESPSGEQRTREEFRILQELFFRDSAFMAEIDVDPVTGMGVIKPLPGVSP